MHSISKTTKAKWTCYSVLISSSRVLLVASRTMAAAPLTEREQKVYLAKLCEQAERY